MFSTALWDLANSRPVEYLMSSYLFLLLSALSSSPVSLCLTKWIWPNLMNGRHISIPLQFASLYDGQEIFEKSDCLLDLGTDFLVCNTLFVSDALYLAETPYFHGIHFSLELCCEGPRFTSIQGDGCDKGVHQINLGTDRVPYHTKISLVCVICWDVVHLVLQKNFSVGNGA